MEAITTILDFHDEVIFNNIESIFMLMVQALKDPAYNVNIAACEFWSGVVSQWLYCFDETDPDAHVK